jgi:hypothetical protein
LNPHVLFVGACDFIPHVLREANDCNGPQKLDTP